MDFSGWRSAIVGAERIEAKALVDFVRLLAPHGFEPEALRPAYGLAEATLAVSGHPVGLAPNSVVIERRSGSSPEPVPDSRKRLSECDTDIAGQVLVGPETRRAIEGTFEIEDMGVHPLKGKGEPVAVARVVSLSGRNVTPARRQAPKPCSA